ncbi:hypothetical protein ACFT0G_28400 [Streptomyces sp. NPDC057020]|uniref:hypothetical protein n=1 Tax=unclassified Streptomyces TaxID=2593676 RepID=UPI00363B2CA4
MLGYWLAIVRRLTLPALGVGVAFAAAATAVPVLDEGEAWNLAAPGALTAGAAVAFFFAAVLASILTVGAAHTVRRYGITLGPEAAAPVPCVREVRLPTVEGRTVFQLTDAVRYEVENDPALRGAEVTAFGHGTLDLTLRGPSDTKVLVQVRITTGPEGTAAVVEARPEATYKKLDSAVWALARVVEKHTVQALHAEAAGDSL